MPIKAYAYSPEGAKQLSGTLSDITNDAGQYDVLWIDISQPTYPILMELQRIFGFHHLAIEDALNIREPPKQDDFENYIFCVLKYFSTTPEEIIERDHVAIFLGRNYVVSLHGESTDFLYVERQLQKGTGRILHRNADFLFYRLLDVIGDSVLRVLDEIGVTLESMERRVAINPKEDLADEVFEVKKHLNSLYRDLRPLRSVIAILMREDELIEQRTEPFLDDIRDHYDHAISLVELFRDASNGILDRHLVNVSNSTNDVMKTLTILTAIFMPMNIVGALLGMNLVGIEGIFGFFGPLSFWIVLILCFTLSLSILVILKWRGFF